MNYNINENTINEAANQLVGIAKKTPLQFNKRLSTLYNANIYLKREDLQDVRSYKIRGAYNLMSSLSNLKRKKGVVCASAGNHAQGVAQSASILHTKAVIFMPSITPLQKINKVKQFGQEWIEIKLIGQTYDESSTAAKIFCKKKNMVFVHPFDNELTISGQATVGKEIIEQSETTVDYIICPIGGGGLIAGVSIYAEKKAKKCIIVGVEPKGAPSMHESLKQKKIITLKSIDTFVDGAAVQTVGNIPFQIASRLVKKIVLSDEGKVCSTMIDLYQNEGIITEPAGALSISALDDIKDEIRGKTVTCVLSGGNNDIMRYPEIMEKSLIYKGLKHYFIINFAQKPGQLKFFVNSVLGPGDDIARFEYIKKTFKETGPALIGIELSKKEGLQPLINKMDDAQIKYTKIEAEDPLYKFIL